MSARTELPWKGTQAKRWLGATWIPHSGLTKNGALRYCYFYHKTAIGHAAAAEISTDITWHGDRAAHFVNTMMSQGAVLVADTGLVRDALQGIARASRPRPVRDGAFSLFPAGVPRWPSPPSRFARARC